MYNFIAYVLSHMTTYKDIFIICGAVLFATLVAYMFSETNIGALTTLVGIFASVIVCSIGVVALFSLVKADMRESDRRMQAAIEESETFMSIRETNEVFEENLGIGVTDILFHPKKSLDTSTEAVGGLFDGMLEELDKEMEETFGK